MKHFLSLLLIVFLSGAFWSCEYDDAGIWNKVDELDDRVGKLEEAVKAANNNISSLQTLVNALNEKVTVESVITTENGYQIKFSDGTTANITNGKDGVNAPQISIKKDTDGIYYWTLGGEWLTDPETGAKIKAQGQDGKDGAAAIAPQVRINPESKEWEISTDGGLHWISTGVVAEGQTSGSGSSPFTSVDTSDEEWVVFNLTDGSSIRLPRASAIAFELVPMLSDLAFEAGQTRTFDVKMVNIDEYTFTKPDGWKVSLKQNKLKITAPASANTYAERAGQIAVYVVAKNGMSRIVKFEVFIGALLTFEDVDYKGDANYLGQTNWSSLIDPQQYGGKLLYGETGSGPTDYQWYDKNNTFLKHQFPINWGVACYWGGGHAISNYVDLDLKHGDFSHQLSVYYQDANGKGGHNGSDNFCVHYGYKDNSPYAVENLCALTFGDGVARTVDHMYVNWTTYLYNCGANGNALTEPIGPDDFLSLVAIGYSEEGVESGRVEFDFFKNGKIAPVKWNKWDLSSLGKVKKIEFNVTGSSDNGAGFSQPAYFAYDDVAVLF